MKNGPIAYFAGNPVAAKLLMAVLILGGLIAGLRLSIQPIPDIDLRTIIVTVESPGSSAIEIEEDINRQIEESLIGLDGVARIVSEASEGLARIAVELTTFADEDTVLTDVSNQIASIENFPPASADSPKVELSKLKFEILTLAVTSDTASESALREAAENIQNQLLALPTVGHVQLRGVRDREIAIEMNEEELRRHGLSITEVAGTVRHASLNLSFGKLRTDAGDVVLHVTSKKKYGEEFADIPLITRQDGTSIKLGDVSTIRDGFIDDQMLSEIDGVPAIFIRVEAGEAQSLTKTADTIKAWLTDFKPPPTINVVIWTDRADQLADRLADILGNALVGILLVFLCLVLLFELRVAIWITLGIPFAFIGALFFFGFADLTLNLGTMLAFFVMIGIVVDDAVVVGESIATERDRGKGALEAAIAGTRNVAAPITIGAITTILAFVPLLYITAENYQIVQVFFYVALFVLLVSLIETIWILPTHLSGERHWKNFPLQTIQKRMHARLEEIRDAIILPAVSWSVRHVFLTFVLVLAFVALAAWVVQSERVRVVVFDSFVNAGSEIHADLLLPDGTSFDDSTAVARRFVGAAQTINDQLEDTAVRSISVKVGALSDTRVSRGSASRPIQSNHATITLALHERPVRRESPETIERVWRRTVGATADLEELSIQTASVRAKPSVAYSLVHDDRGILQQAARELRSFLETIPGIYALSDSLSPGKRQFQIELTPVGEAAGLTTAMIGKQLRANFHGLEVQRIQRGHEALKVMVRYPLEHRQSLRKLASEQIIVRGGHEMPLSAVATVTEERDPASLMRIDGRRAVLVNAQVDLIAATPIQARRLVAENFLPDLQTKYPGLVISKDAGARDESQMMEDLALLVPIVLIAMYALMAAFLRSYWKPLIAVIGVPIAAAGAVIGHWVLGWHMTALSIFGIIGVTGVIVNDALVLLDRYNVIRRDNEAIPAIAAASAAARDRFRAVFLTSVTTVLGLSPLLYERSDDLLFLVPFVVSMLGGLVAVTAFTLLVLPALAMLIDGRKEP